MTTTTTTDDGAIRAASGQRPDARQDARLDWFRDAHFGMFIHWGLYAIPAGEWKGQAIPGIAEWIMLRARIPVAEYERLAEQFNPIQFDADAWVSLAAQAGARYLVVTAKHHDGFCMYRSAVSDYNIVDATPFGRDPMHELAAACRRHGVRLCFYYSQTQDWHHPHGDGNDWDYVEATKAFDAYVENYVRPQVRELLANYGPIGLIWFDTPKRMTAEQSRELHVFDWPADGTIQLPALPGQVASASLLATGAEVQVQREGDGWQLQTRLPNPPDFIDTVITLELST